MCDFGESVFCNQPQNRIVVLDAWICLVSQDRFLRSFSKIVEMGLVKFSFIFCTNFFVAKLKIRFPRNNFLWVKKFSLVFSIKNSFQRCQLSQYHFGIHNSTSFWWTWYEIMYRGGINQSYSPLVAAGYRKKNL